jgi:hypothetical protein
MPANNNELTIVVVCYYTTILHALPFFALLCYADCGCLSHNYYCVLCRCYPEKSLPYATADSCVLLTELHF